MIRTTLAALALTFAPLAAAAQAVEATVCDVANHPMKYDGKMVRVKGVVQADFDSFFIRGESCNSGIWLSYPAGTRARSGPAAGLTLQLAGNATATPVAPRPAVTLERNPAFETFDTLLSARVKTPGMCLGCVNNDVMATLTGRIDGTEDAGLKRDADGKITALTGFGNMSLWGVRMVLQSVADPTPKEIDFSAAPRVSGDNANSGGKDFIAATKKAEEAFGKGNDSALQIQRALDALGAPGVNNGVVIAFDNAAEIQTTEGVRSAATSPDGVLYTIHLDMEKLRGDALSRAIAHQGELVADLRGPSPTPYLALQQKAWQTVLIVTIGARQKTLTLPGGTVLWTEAWPQPERNANASAALNSYLINREQAP